MATTPHPTQLSQQPCAHLLLATAPQQRLACLPAVSFSRPPPTVGFLTSHPITCTPPASTCLLHHHHHHHHLHHHVKPVCATSTQPQQHYVPRGHGQYVGTPHPAAAATATAARNSTAVGRRLPVPLRPIITAVGDVMILPKAASLTQMQPALQSAQENVSLQPPEECSRLAAVRCPALTPTLLYLSGKIENKVPTAGGDRCSPAERSTRVATLARQIKPDNQRQPEITAPLPMTSAPDLLASPLPLLSPPALPPLSPVQPPTTSYGGASRSLDDDSSRSSSVGSVGSSSSSSSIDVGGGSAPTPLRKVLGPLDNRAGGLLCSSPHGGEAVSRQHHNAKERMRRIKDSCQLMRELIPGMTEKTDKATVFEYAAQYVLYIKKIIGTKYDRDFLQKYSPY